MEKDSSDDDSDDDDINRSLDDGEIIENNDTANLKQVKCAELIRQKVNLPVELQDGIQKIQEISEKYAKSYADNFNTKEITYEKELKKLQEQIKKQQNELSQFRQQQQYGIVFPPQYGFQYPSQLHLNEYQYPFQHYSLIAPHFQQPLYHYIKFSSNLFNNLSINHLYSKLFNHLSS